MAAVRRFEDLEAWRMARGLARNVYVLAAKGSFARDFGLRDQIQRAAVSVMANIAEGFERDGRREFVRFLTIAKASAGEVESHAFVAVDLGYISEPEFSELRSHLGRCKQLIRGLIRYLKAT